MSICDKNNPPERSDEELKLSRQERERVESIIRNGTLGSSSPTAEIPADDTADDPPAVPAVVRGDINEFNRLSNIENSINKVSGGNAVKGNKLPAIAKQVRDDGVTASVDEILKVAQMQNAILTTALGSGSYNLRFRNPRNKSDCSKNINDLIIAQLKKIIMKLIRDSDDDPDQLMFLLDVIEGLSLEISNIFKLIEKAKGKSLADLLILAKNAGFLDRIGIIQNITKKFGGVVGLNSILANLERFDVCNMSDSSSSGNLLPKPSKVNPKPAPPHPDPGPLITTNLRSQAQTAAFIDHKDTAGDLINGAYNSTDLKDDPSYGSMLTSLNALYYGFKNEVSVKGTSQFQVKADREIERIIENKRDEWSGDILNEFKARAESITTHVIADASILGQDYARRTFA